MAGPGGGWPGWRLTADRVRVYSPCFSPDGSRIAWAAQRDGAREVWVTPTEGGPARRLSHWGDPDTAVLGWTAAGEVLAATPAGRMSRTLTWAHALPLDGGPARELP